jgi:pimeloyl-ACP methyl ester carboxylesterase
MIGRASLFATLALVAAFTSAPPDDRGRPVILMVHGRGMTDQDTASLRSLWLDGLNAGAKSLSNGRLLTDRDVRLVWYADVLQPSSTERCSYADTDPRAKRDASTDPELKSFVSLIGNILGAITSFVADQPSLSELRSLSGDAQFLSDSRARCGAEQRLATAIDGAAKEGRPVIVVAHSLGSLVAYDYLSSLRQSGVVQRVVSVGSPLGSSELRRLLIGGDSTETFTLPTSVKSWINVRSAADPLAVPLSIGGDVVTTTPPDEPDAHDMVGYLKSAAAARAIVGGWCDAFLSARPASCEHF